MIHVFTSSAPNYVGKVRTLCSSIREQLGSEVTIHWLVADLLNEELRASFDDGASIDHLIFVDDFEEFRSRTWLFQHDVVELSTAIKPAIAAKLLARPDCDMLLYFDPDMVLFSPHDDLIEALRGSSLVLTPHLLQPEVEAHAVLDHELSTLRHGIFNLGFFGVRDCPEGHAFLAWWAKRCRDFCWGDWRSGVFTDQKWINFAPVFFADTAILRSPRFNIAPWNINQRTLRGTFDEGFTVDGEPLGFYHFTGFDSGAHLQVLERYAPSCEAAFALYRWYEQRTRHLIPQAEIPWRLGCFEDRSAIRKAHRQIYRDREDLQIAFPNPYRAVAGEMSLQLWMEHEGPKEYPELLGDGLGAPG
ncbi:MAG: glycosyl transferase [Acidobacteriota bacterium]